MNSFVVPPSPNWYRTEILACAPDNTLVYGSKTDLIVIDSKPHEDSLQINVIDHAHGQRVFSVDINSQWALPNKWVVSSGEDNLVKLWNISTLSKISLHEAHKDQKDKLIGARFLTEDRILSVSEGGDMYIWHPSIKQYTKLNNFFMTKVSISCFSPCPHASYITAFGMKNGLIVVANLKKNGSIMHKLRGHTNDIVTLSWCPAPINIFPSKPNNFLKGTIKQESERCIQDNAQLLKQNNDINIEENIKTTDNKNSEIIINVNKIPNPDQQSESISSCKPKKQNPWVNLKFEDDSDDDNIETEQNSIKEVKVNDFLNECNILKKKIVEFSKDSTELAQNSSSVTIKANNVGNKREEEDDRILTTKQESNLSNALVVIEHKPVQNEEISTISKKNTEVCEDLNYSEKVPLISPIEGMKDRADLSLDNNCTNLKLDHNSPSELESNHDKIEDFTINQRKHENDYHTPENETNAEGDSLKHFCSTLPKEEVDKEFLLDYCNKKNDNCDKTVDIEKFDIDNEKSKSINQSLENESETCQSVCSTSVEEEPRKEYLLASSGKDSTIYIWRAGTDGRMQCFFKLPEKKYYLHKNKKVRETTWNPLIWITPSTLLTATRKGELLKYNLPTPLNAEKQYKVLHNEHNALIFTIAAYVPLLTTENWLSESDLKIWTFSHDMYLLNTNMDTEVAHSTSLETLSAIIHVIAQSPLDPNRIALGLSNGSIKILNANDIRCQKFYTTNYSPKIYSKITSLAWHPSNELILAFSTEEGTIGLLNINNRNKATWFKQSFSNKVHKLQWGLSTHNETLNLYATGEGNLMYFDANMPNKEPQQLELSDAAPVYTFAWKLDKSLLLVVEATGKIIIFNSDLSIKATYYQKKKISNVAWHPESECVSEEPTAKSYWVAAALDSALYIFDFRELTEKNGTLDIQNVTKFILERHQANIQCIVWNPFNGDRLVTAGEDGMAHVWDLSNREILASYYGQNFEPIKSIIWSPIQEDIIICSSTNASLIGWKMSDYPAPISEEIMNKYKIHAKTLRKINAIKESDSVEKTMKKAKKSTKNTILPAMNVGVGDNVDEKVKLLQDLLEWKENRSNKKTNGVPTIKQLFGSKDDISKLLTFTEASHTERGKHEAASMVSFWKGDLQKTIQETIDQRRISPLLIALAPTISLSLWQKACETYAIQLEEKADSDPLEIATYYLACQNIEKAVDCLSEREMFKEALALVKCRLPDNNVFEEKILNKWANFSSYCGNLETAAQCYIVLGKYEEAVQVLFKRSEPEILNFAFDLAKITGNTELIKAVEFRCVAFAKTNEIENDNTIAVKKDDVEDIEKTAEVGVASNENQTIDTSCQNDDTFKQIQTDDLTDRSETEDLEEKSTNQD